MAAPHLLADLRVAQIHRERGIPRYAQTLLLNLARRHPEIRLSWLIEEGDPPVFADALGGCGRFVRQLEIAALPPVTHYLQACVSDRGRGADVLFPPELAVHRPRLGAIVYDLIPALFPDLYLRDPETARGYLRSLELLPELDKLFAISECTRIDTIAWGCEPDRVVTIFGGVDENRFSGQPAEPPMLPEKYWLYIGGDDPRKNLPTLFAAFALLAQRMEAPPSLVVVCSLSAARKAQLRDEARAAGLPLEALFLTGFVPDGAMPAVIRGAVATIFPSRYEGLGLPVLESYQFGKAALVSDCSSLIELAPPVCRFDQDDPEAIARAVIAFHADPAIEAASLAHAPMALDLCRWEAAADKLADWIVESDSVQSNVPVLNVVTTLPPDIGGIGLYGLKTLAVAPWRTLFHVPWGGVNFLAARAEIRRQRLAQHAEAPPPRLFTAAAYRPNGAPTIWVLGNSEHHVETLRMLMQAGRSEDWLYLHEAQLGGLLAAYNESQRGKQPISWRGGGDPLAALRAILEAVAPRNVLVNSPYCRDLVEKALSGQEGRIEVTFLPIFLGEATCVPSRQEAWAELRVMHVGILGASKQPELLVKALELLREQLPGRQVRLVFAGYAVRDYLVAHNLLRPWIDVLENPADDELAAAMVQADVGVQLRWPQHGESSGAVCQWLALRHPVVTTCAGSFTEFDRAAYLVAPDVSPELLAKQILVAAAGAPESLDAYLLERSVAAWHAQIASLLRLKGGGAAGQV